jgi:hypothetical protein
MDFSGSICFSAARMHADELKNAEARQNSFFLIVFLFIAGALTHTEKLPGLRCAEYNVIFHFPKRAQEDF